MYVWRVPHVNLVSKRKKRRMVGGRGLRRVFDSLFFVLPDHGLVLYLNGWGVRYRTAWL
jgi:hypothetical protein